MSIKHKKQLKFINAIAPHLRLDGKVDLENPKTLYRITLDYGGTYKTTGTKRKESELVNTYFYFCTHKSNIPNNQNIGIETSFFSLHSLLKATNAFMIDDVCNLLFLHSDVTFGVCPFETKNEGTK